MNALDHALGDQFLRNNERKEIKNKYSPTHEVRVTLVLRTNKRPEMLAQMARLSSGMIEGVENVEIVEQSVKEIEYD